MIEDYETMTGEVLGNAPVFGDATQVRTTESMPVPVETRYHGAATTGKLVLCSVCGYAYAKTECVRSKGRWYCVPNGCSKDLEKPR